MYICIFVYIYKINSSVYFYYDCFIVTYLFIYLFLLFFYYLFIYFVLSFFLLHSFSSFSQTIVCFNKWFILIICPTVKASDDPENQVGCCF